MGTIHQLRSLLLVAMIAGCAPAPSTPDVHPAAPAPTADEVAVLAAVEQFFETMTSRDAAGARAVLDSTGDFVSVRWNDAGEPVVRRSPNREYLATIADDAEVYLERMWDPEVKVHGPIATVWTPYDFHVDGAFSHCGVDIFQLRRADHGWLITGGTYTVERTGCAESPLGPPES